MGDAGGRDVYIPFFTAQHQAQDVRDYVEGDDIAQPWSLGLAQKCYDMQTGQLLHLPYSGGAWDQDDDLMELIKFARLAWYVFKYIPANKMKLTTEDSNFIAWVHGEVADA